MAIIYSYPQAKPKASDLLIGTVTYDGTETFPTEGNPTRTFSVQNIVDLAASYELSTTQSGTNATLRLTNDLGSLSVVNLVKGNGITLSSNGSNAITITNSGVVSVNPVDTNYIDTSASVSSGVLTISSGLSATGSATSSSYLRGDNTWSIPVTKITGSNSTFISVGPSSTSTGSVIITANLSASGTPSASNFLRGDNVWAVPSGGGTVTSVNSGTGISVDNTDPANPIINNTGVTKIVAGNDIEITPIDGTGTVTINSISQGGVTSIIAGDNITLDPLDGLGDVTITAADTVYTAGSDIDITNQVITNTAPDQIVSITGTGAVNVTGSYPSFSIDVPSPEAGVITKDSFVSSGSTDYTLSQIPISSEYIEVFISGVYQEDSTYTISGDVVSLSTAPDNGDTIEIVTFNLGYGAGGGGGTGVTSLAAGNGISLSGATGGITVTNSLPDQVVSLTGQGSTTITGTYPSFNISSVNTTYTAGTGLDLIGTEFSNTSPDQIVTLTNGTGITTSGTYPDFTITNSAPDQTVVLNGTGGTTVTGTYPNFTIDSPTDSLISSIVGGTGISIDNTDPTNPIVNNIAPDQIVNINAGDNVTVTGSYPSYTISASGGGTSGIVASESLTTGIVPRITGSNSIGNSNIQDNESVTGIQSNLYIEADGEIFTVQGLNASSLYVGVFAGNVTNSASAGYNVSLGNESSQSLTIGSRNTAVGYQSLKSNSSGNNNVAVGTEALEACSQGNSNTAVGSKAAAALIGTSTGNTSIGASSMLNSTASLYNTSVGSNSMVNTTGRDNVAVGYNSLNSNTTGAYNTVIGSNAGAGVSTGSGNVIIGGYTSAGSIPAFNVTGESNRISIGSTQITNAYVNVGWTIVSDERDKTNFSEVPHGLDFVSKLKPVSYQLRESRDSENAVGNIKYGFKAQDILVLEGDNPVIIDNENEDKLRYNESNLIAVLVKSIQELEERIKTLETK